jgi:hypothetical protein
LLLEQANAAVRERSSAAELKLKRMIKPPWGNRGG